MPKANPRSYGWIYKLVCLSTILYCNFGRAGGGTTNADQSVEKSNQQEDKQAVEQALALKAKYQSSTLLPASLPCPGSEAATSPGLGPSQQKSLDEFCKMVFSQHPTHGTFPWQSTENYCAGFSMDMVRLYELLDMPQDSGTREVFHSLKPIESLQSYFIKWNAWTSDQPLDLKNHSMLPKDTDSATWNSTKIADRIAALQSSAKFHYEGSVRNQKKAANISQNLNRIPVLLAEIETSQKEFERLRSEKELAMKKRPSWGTSDYDLWEKDFDKKNNDYIISDKQLHALKTEKIQLSELHFQYLKETQNSNLNRIFAAMLEARASYLNEHQSQFAQRDAQVSALRQNYYSQAPDQSINRFQDKLDKPWLDLMPVDFYFSPANQKLFDPPFQELQRQFDVLDPNNQVFSPIIQAIRDYHNIPKSTQAGIGPRINALLQIAKLASVRPEALMKQIAARAQLKANYLLNIAVIKTSTLRQVFRLPHSGKNTRIPVVSVRADKIKDLDPAKRESSEYFEKWKELVGKDPSTPNYFLWLETQDTTGMTQDLRHSFLTTEQKRVTFENGLATHRVFSEQGISNNGNNAVADGEYNYNIDETGELYILPVFETLEKFRKLLPDLFKSQDPDNTSLENVLNHDTILGGKNIGAAGVVTFKHGKIVKIDTNSGHYRPKMIQNLRPALKALLKAHPGSIQSDTQIGDYNPTHSISMPFSEFLRATPKDVGE